MLGVWLWCALGLVGVWSKVVVFNGTPNIDSGEASWKNAYLLNETLASLAPGDTFVVPNATYYTMGGIKAKGLKGVVLMLEGTVVFSEDMDSWPTDGTGRVLECLEFEDLDNVTFSSSGMGLLDGRGSVWWGIPGLGYVERGENRPRLLAIANSKNILVENWFFLNSPYWTFWAHGIDGLEVRNSHVSAKRDDYDGHDLIDLTAFNTDGFDVSGRNVWIHDCSVWNQDDCFCVQDNSQNMLFERLSASGLGLTIGSIGGSTVKNITFRDIYMPNTYKGIYLKFRAEGGMISDIYYENIVIDKPEQWPIWIGPAQEADSSNLCAARPCSLCWPEIPFASCTPAVNGIFSNITLRNVTINSPVWDWGSGVILGSESYPMDNIVFDGVVVKSPNAYPDYYACSGVSLGVAKGGTWPVPSCFNQ
eukprot:TRINITY_DN13472_c0_g2_i1.p1 TRINITY_DN13472_c0_g2~~TRINITY_DN13472_c0_g2_i1.p1  ORF type:complete len:420 (-),score=83.51 TRINITY_DN13472_c0_g2_i1:8-1267(-)